MRPASLRACGVMRCRVCGACQRARSTAPTVRAREMRRPALRPPRSAIARLRSGGGRFPVRCISHRCVPLKGAVGRAVGTGARARPLGGHSAPACPCGVGCAPHPPMSGIRLGRNTSRRRLPPLSGDARIPPPERAPAPFPPRVRWRASCTWPFLRCAFRAPRCEQGKCIVS